MKKTNVRAYGSSRREAASYVPSPVALLGSVARVSPKLAGWFASRVFTRTRRFARPAREERYLANAQRLELARGVAAWTWGEGPLCLLVHGWEGRGAQLGAYAAPLVARGFRVATFDAPGHGSSLGTHAVIGDWLNPIAELSERFGGPAAVVAHSFGCPAVNLALQQGLQLNALVYLAPPDALDLGAKTFARATGLGDAGEAALRTQLSSMTGVRFEEQRVATFGAGMRVPLLVVHDEGDVDVSVRCAATYARCWPDSTVSTTRGLGHRRILGDGRVIRLAVDYLDAQHRSSPGLSRWFAQSPGISSDAASA